MSKLLEEVRDLTTILSRLVRLIYQMTGKLRGQSYLRNLSVVRHTAVPFLPTWITDRGDRMRVNQSQLKRSSDFIMPLLRADDISFAIPNWNAVTPHYFSQRASELLSECE